VHALQVSWFSPVTEQILNSWKPPMQPQATFMVLALAVACGTIRSISLSAAFVRKLMRHASYVGLNGIWMRFDAHPGPICLLALRCSSAFARPIRKVTA
jgi:hypothetical protein